MTFSGPDNRTDGAPVSAASPPSATSPVAPASTTTAATASPGAADLAASASRLRLAITRTARRLRQEAREADGAGELTPTATAALATIERHGPLTPSELAETERVRRPTATRTLRGLLDAGLVERAPDPEDGRSALVSVTAAGRERLRRLRGRKNAYLARRMAELPDEDVATLERAAAILERALEGEAATRPAPEPSR